MRPELFLRLFFLVSERILGCLGAGLVLEVALAEGYLLTELLDGQVVEVGAAGTEVEAHTLDVFLHAEVLHGGCTALLVGDGGVEDAQTLQLDAVALCDDFGNGLRQADDNLLQHCTVELNAEGDEILCQSTGADRTLIVSPCEPAVEDL